MLKVNLYYTLTKSASLNVIDACKFQRKDVDPATCKAGGGWGAGDLFSTDRLVFAAYIH